MILHNARGHTQALYRLKKCPDMKLHEITDIFWYFIQALLTAAANLNLLTSAWADAWGCNLFATYITDGYASIFQNNSCSSQPKKALPIW